MSALRSSWLVLVAAVVVGILFWFRPGGIDGPRPEPVPVDGKGFDHGAFTAVLQSAVAADGAVDYAALRADPAPLDRYLGQLRAVGPGNAPHRFKTADDRLAYYINAYNAFVLAAVRDACPVSDVQSMYPGGGLFWRVDFLMGGDEITLSTLESELIRGVAQRDPAIRFALVKGAKGFPALRREAYSPEGVRGELDAVARVALDDPRIAERKGDTLVLSALFQDYAVDFVPDVETWLEQVKPALLEGDPRVEYRPFDWSLNGACD